MVPSLGHPQELLMLHQANLVPTIGGLTNFTNTLDLKVFLCTEKSLCEYR